MENDRVISADDKAKIIREEAVEVAKTLVSHAQETARQMIINTGMDTQKIPLICNRIVKIEESLVWMKWLLFGITGGIGAIVVALFINVLSKS